MTHVTAYFDPNKHTEICVDASPVGVAAILAQTDQNGGNRFMLWHTLVDLSRILNRGIARWTVKRLRWYEREKKKAGKSVKSG